MLVTMSTGSIVVRRSLGRQLRAARNAAGKTPGDVNTAGIASKTKLNRMETGQGPYRVADVRALCWLYGLDEPTTNTLCEMALNTAAEGWWENYSDVLPSWFSMYVELETAATELLSWDPELVPGLLQLPDYVRALAESDPQLTSQQVERNVNMRMQRQSAVAARDTPLKIRAVLGAGVLARQVGGKEVMEQQRKAMVEAVTDGRAAVGVLPWDVGAHPAMQGAFAVLKFDSADHPDVVYLETRAGGRYVTKEEVVADYLRLFAVIEERSTPIEEYTP